MLGGNIAGNLGKQAVVVIYFLLVLAPIYVNVYPCSEYVNWVVFSAVTVALLENWILWNKQQINFVSKWVLSICWNTDVLFFSLKNYWCILCGFFFLVNSAFNNVCMRVIANEKNEVFRLHENQGERGEWIFMCLKLQDWIRILSWFFHSLPYTDITNHFKKTCFFIYNPAISVSQRGARLAEAKLMKSRGKVLWELHSTALTELPCVQWGVVLGVSAFPWGLFRQSWGQRVSGCHCGYNLVSRH